MAYNNIEYGFKIGNASVVDDRLVLTKLQMRDINDLRMPDVYFAVCADDSKLYVYNRKNEKLLGSNDTGRFRVYESATPVDVKVDDVQLNLHDNVLESVVEDKVAKLNLPFTVRDGKICAIFED